MLAAPAALHPRSVSAVAAVGDGPDWLPFKTPAPGIRVNCTYSNGCAGGYHTWYAIDFNAPSLTPIYAAGDGTATGYSGCDPETYSTCGPDNFGNAVKIVHSNGLISWYGHLDSVVAKYDNKSDAVKAGDLLGYSGNSGHSFGAHLHFEVRQAPGNFGTSIETPPLRATHGSEVVEYPSALGYSTWGGAGGVPCGIQFDEPNCHGDYRVWSDGVTGGGGGGTTSSPPPPPEVITATGQNISGVEGSALSHTVATFTDSHSEVTADQFAASIDWGDGGSSAGTVTATNDGSFAVSGSHTYVEEGTYPVSVHVSDDAASADASGTATIVDAPIFGAGRVFTTENPVNNAVVATFTDANPFGDVSDFGATINWGDGTTSQGTIGAAGGGFTVSGTHSYPPNGPFTYSVATHICDVGGECTDAASTIRITYMTGRAYGFYGTLSLPLLGTGTRGPFPDTGEVKRSTAGVNAPPCRGYMWLRILAGTYDCASVVTSTGPATAVSTGTVNTATLNTGIAGIPIIRLTGMSATATASCGHASATSHIVRLLIGWTPITVATGPNVVINLGVAGAKLVLNEQTLTLGPGGDRNITVNAVHLIVPKTLGTGANLILGSATAGVHNCVPTGEPGPSGAR